MQLLPRFSVHASSDSGIRDQGSGLRAQGSGLKMAGFCDQTKSVNRKAQTGPFFTLFTNPEVFQEKLGLWRPEDAGVWGQKNIFYIVVDNREDENGSGGHLMLSSQSVNRAKTAMLTRSRTRKSIASRLSPPRLPAGACLLAIGEDSMDQACLNPRTSSTPRLASWSARSLPWWPMCPRTHFQVTL